MVELLHPNGGGLRLYAFGKSVDLYTYRLIFMVYKVYLIKKYCLCIKNYKPEGSGKMAE